MTTQGNVLPERISPDAIVEALVEFRIEHGELPERVIGRLLDAQLWDGFEQVRLPTADIPQPIRDIDPQLKYQPSFELRKSDGSRIAKIGGHVLSYHVTGAYPGWAVFRSDIDITLREVIEKLKSPSFSRIGFRYINILRPDKHHIHGLKDTNITLRVGTEEVTDSVNVNYTRAFDTAHTVTVKVATHDLVSGNVPAGFSLLCDIDVATRPSHRVSSYGDAMVWIDEAHNLEKAAFFAILPEELTRKLVVEPKGNSNG